MMKRMVKRKVLSSSVARGGLVELVADKWKSIKSASCGEKKNQQDSYIQLKNQELDLQDATRRKAAELKREELALQRQTLELALKRNGTKTSSYIIQKLTRFYSQDNNRH
ncbi:hypothetical protein Tco_0547724 [Tanacetum coccineum]